MKKLILLPLILILVPLNLQAQAVKWVYRAIPEAKVSLESPFELTLSDVNVKDKHIKDGAMLTYDSDSLTIRGAFLDINDEADIRMLDDSLQMMIDVMISMPGEFIKDTLSQKEYAGMRFSKIYSNQKMEAKVGFFKKDKARWFFIFAYAINENIRTIADRVIDSIRINYN